MSHETVVQLFLIGVIGLLAGTGIHSWYKWYTDRQVDTLSSVLQSLGLKVEARKPSIKTHLRIAAERLLIFGLCLGVLGLTVMGTAIYFEMDGATRVEATGEGPEAIATPPEGRAGSIPDSIEAATACTFNDREVLQQAMIACTRRGSKSVSRQVGGRDCFTFECGDGER